MEPSACSDYIRLEQEVRFAESRPFQRSNAAHCGVRGGSLAVSGDRCSGREEKGATGRRQLRPALDLHACRRRSQALGGIRQQGSVPHRFQIHSGSSQEPSVAGPCCNPLAAGRSGPSQGRFRLRFATHRAHTGELQPGRGCRLAPICRFWRRCEERIAQSGSRDQGKRSRGRQLFASTLHRPRRGWRRA